MSVLRKLCYKFYVGAGEELHLRPVGWAVTLLVATPSVVMVGTSSTLTRWSSMPLLEEYSGTTVSSCHAYDFSGSVFMKRRTVRVQLHPCRLGPSVRGVMYRKWKPFLGLRARCCGRMREAVVRCQQYARLGVACWLSSRGSDAKGARGFFGVGCEGVEGCSMDCISSRTTVSSPTPQPLRQYVRGDRSRREGLQVLGRVWAMRERSSVLTDDDTVNIPSQGPRRWHYLD